MDIFADYVVITRNGFTLIDMGSDDIHIRDEKTGVMLRISHKSQGLEITSVGNEFIPQSVNGVPSFYVRKRKR